ncbi:Ig-like domain-containing protein [Deinococcus sp. 12RED42]|uniref:beta strand repeat-containing protein n=1 Tax=Deinococcus sp. 12RED42 TaxID=2745872 RepID=UPI001E4DA438|nr:Ig-like domain-containing protein [Deinococcus sp. 12RED42]MCD0165275.1 Ig-like domain repeat protein [Deinococcus sp. 12RED42]
MKTAPRNPLLLLLTGTLVACGGGGAPSTPGNTAPAVNIKANGRTITADTYLPTGGRLDVSVSDPDIGGSIKKVVYSIDNGPKTDLTPAASMTLALPGLSGGQHEVTVEATDNVGAVTTVKAPFLIDAAAPTLTTVNLNGQAATDTATFTVGDAALLSVTAQDTRGDTQNTAGPVSIRVLESGTLVKSVSGNTLTADLTKDPKGQARTAGTVIFTVEAEDSVGFVRSRNIAVTFNAATTGDDGVIAPTFTWLSPASDFVKGGGTVTLRATATRNGQDLSSQIAYTATCGTITGSTWTLGTDCADGSKQSVTATVTDGGRSFSSPAKVITVDASDPTVQITSPQQGQSFTQNPIKISVTGTDAVSGLDRILVEAKKDGDTNYTQVGVVTAASGDVTWAPMNGTYTLRATATDKTGRTSTTTLSGIKVNLTSSDATPPTVALSPIPATPQRATITVTATANDTDSGVAKVDLYDGGTLIESKATGVGGKYTFSLDTTKLSDGAHTLRAIAFDNAGLSAETSASLTVDNTAPVVNWISPADGTVTRGEVTLNATTNEGTVTYTVDGTPLTGNKATFSSDGTHTITATAQDAAGNRTTSTIRVTSDATAPTAQITGPTAGSTLTSNPVTINVTGNDTGSGVGSLEVFANGTSVGTVSGASGTVTWTPTSGTYDLTVIATDKAGNKSAASAPVNVTVKLATADTTAPTFVGTATVQPAPTATFSRGVITLDGFVKDPESGVSQVALFNGGVRLNATPSLSVQPDGSTRYALTLDSKALADGTYTLTIQATNGVGLVSNQDISVKIDNTAPTLNWNAPTTVGSAGTITLNATTETGATITYAASCGTITDNTWAYGDCQDGTPATLTATATDAAGNTTTQTRTITVDRTAPTVQITSPTQGQKFTQNPITIAVSGTDNVAVDHIDVLSGTTKIGTVTGTQGTVTWAAPNGNQTLTARAYDRAGNSTDTTVTFTVALTTSDVTAPTGSVTAPTADLRGQATLSVTASDTNGSGVATVSLYIDGLLSGTQTTGVDTTYTFPVDTTKLSDGKHAITAVITDNAGNTFTTTPQVIVRVNNAAPTVTISNPANGALLGEKSDLTVKVTGTDTTPDDSLSYEYNVDGGAFAPYDPKAPIKLPTPTEGTHTVTVRATDKAGNTGTATSTYTYDGTAPTVQITSPTQGQMFTNTPVTISLIGQDSGTGVASIKVYANDGSTDELIGTLGGNGSVTWYPRKTDGSPYTIKAIATDRAGNTSSDTTSPGATVTNVKVQTASKVDVEDLRIEVPSANPRGAQFTDSGLAYVRGPLVVSSTATTTAPSFSLADLQIDGQARSTLAAPAAQQTLQPTFNFDFDALNEGLHDVGVRFTDSLGTVGIKKATVFVDKTAPVITWNTPSLTKAAVDLNAKAVDAASSANVPTIPVTYSENGKDVAGPITGDGQHTVTATAADNVGNIGTRTVTFTIDSTAPEVIPALPDNRDKPQEFTTAPITLTATATDATTSVTSIELQVGLQGTDTNPTQFVTLGRQNGASYSAVFTPSEAGRYAVRYIALDAVGNSSTVERHFTYSVSTPPTEKAPEPRLSVVGSGPYSGNISVSVSGNYDSLSQVDRMILEITDAKGVVDNSTYVTTQSQTTFSVDSTKLANGEAYLSVIAYTKSGLRTITKPPLTIEISNILNPTMAIAAPSDGALITSPVVPVRVTITNAGTPALITVGSLEIELYDYRGQLVSVKKETVNDSSNPARKQVQCIYSNGGMNATCDTTFDIAGLPADRYTIRAKALAEVTGGSPSTQEIRATSSFTSNTSSVNPPAATISFPTAVTLNQVDTNGNYKRVPARIDSGSGFFATVSDDKGVQYVEARLVGPYAEGNIETDGTRQCQASGSIISGENEINVLLLNVPGASNTVYTPQDIFIPKLDIDGSTYVPNSKAGQRYDLRVTTADTEGNRNIQCVPVKVERGLPRPRYDVSNTTTPSTPSNTPGELTYTSGTWILNSIPANSRVVAILYSNGKQVGTEFFAKTNGNSLTVSQTFSDVGTYEVKWLIEDMSDIAPTQLNSTGVVTTQAGGYINVARNPK